MKLPSLPKKKADRRKFLSFVALTAGVLVLLWWRLGSLLPGFNHTELVTSRAPLGLHDLYNHPLYLPLKLVQTIVFHLFPDHGLLLTRLPATVFGGLAILAFAYVLRQWHGGRTAAFATLLFATSAWTLHSSRLASFDVLYLWALPTLLLAHLTMQRRSQSAYVFYGSMLLWGVCLYIPGLVWFVLLSMYLQRKAIATGWKHLEAAWQKALYVLAGLIWLPVLLHDLVKHSADLRLWLGLPDHFAAPLTLLKHFVAVPVHLFVRGPQYPENWLGRAPILDIFSLMICALGIYFYLRHWRASRSRLLGGYFILGFILVGIGGAVSLSLLVPLLYLVAATGIAYLLHDWLQTFPLNPIARGLGVGLVAAAVVLSCNYNLRAYFVAWPHNETTQATFRYRP
ncbi:MAG: hypothetical protein JWL89_361 [Candidatus Saccharibacteria bacterium]|nr:hypothetical protein [Candidatus Saccharibacteria bacterium]